MRFLKPTTTVSIHSRSYLLIVSLSDPSIYKPSHPLNSRPNRIIAAKSPWKDWKL